MKNDKITRRRLDTMPFDKKFNTEDGERLLHATGYEVCAGDTENPANWENEYADDNGELYYGH